MTRKQAHGLDAAPTASTHSKRRRLGCLLAVGAIVALTAGCAPSAPPASAPVQTPPTVAVEVLPTATAPRLPPTPTATTPTPRVSATLAATATPAPTRPSSTSPATPTVGATRLSTPTAERLAGWKTYSSEAYRVVLRYPPDWQQQQGYEERYGGNGGFFQISAIGGQGLTVDQVAEYEAGHKLQPYGSRPTVEKLSIQGQEARLILPSEDQPKEMEGLATLIVRAPQPIKIRGDTYTYLTLAADKDHIREIADTLKMPGA